MIVKERNATEHADRGRRGAAGAAAEAQMAHYLRRAFAEGTAVLVLNDLRLPVPNATDDFAQIDHLLIHRYGLIVVESKSVHDTITVTEAGEWFRTYGDGKRKGMPSPIAQARRQADALRRVLIDRFDPLGHGRLNGVPIDVLVAISDGGIIDRRTDVPEVCKADAVHDRVRRLVEGYRAGPKRFDGAARRQVAEHLLSHHTPALDARPGQRDWTSRTPPPPAQVAAPDRPTCRHCGSGALHAQHGRYNYYFRCLSCTKNTRIAKGCPCCGSMVARVRKDLLKFFKDCPACGRTTLIYVNASLADLDGPEDDRSPRRPHVSSGTRTSP